MDTKQYIELVYGDTDSLYMSYEGLLSTIEGVENWTQRQKTEFIANLSLNFLNKHNKDFMTEYYRTRNVRNVDTDMVHEFELETIALAGVWLDVKKRYGQMLLWKDGKYFDEDSLPLKVKGLEVIKSSYPALARKILKGLMHTLIGSEDDNLAHIINAEMMAGLQEWRTADVEAIAPAIKVNNYTRYIKSDNGPYGPEWEKGAPFQVKGLAYYNWLRQTKNLPGDPVYGGKCKYYIVKNPNKRRKTDPDQIFTFEPSKLPAWAEKYAPIDRDALFNKCVLDPINRILSAINMSNLSINGNISPSLFDNMFD